LYSNLGGSQLAIAFKMLVIYFTNYGIAETGGSKVSDQEPRAFEEKL
jgi:hypothetical protein